MTHQDTDIRRIHLVITDSSGKNICKVIIATDDSDSDIKGKVTLLLEEGKITVDQIPGLVSKLCGIRDKYSPKAKKRDGEPGRVVASIFPKTKG